MPVTPSSSFDRNKKTAAAPKQPVAPSKATPKAPSKKKV